MQIQISWLLQKPTDLDLLHLQRQGISGFSRTRVNIQVDWTHLEFFSANFIREATFVTSSLLSCNQILSENWSALKGKALLQWRPLLEGRQNRFNSLSLLIPLRINCHKNPKYWDRKSFAKCVDPDQMLQNVAYLIKVCTVCHSSSTTCLLDTSRGNRMNCFKF